MKKPLRTLCILVILTAAITAIFLVRVYPHLYFSPLSNAREILLMKDGYPYYTLSYRQGDLFQQVQKSRVLWGEQQSAFQHASYHLYVRTGDNTYRYDIQKDGSLFSYLPIWHLTPSKKLKDLLLKEVNKIDQALRERYGELIPWEEARKLFPRMGYATVIDFESRLSFRVQRRAGSDHADVQPLTRQDTAIMKKIFNNHWTWDRRAIIVDTGTRRIAASMNGRPHGAGAIRNNNFNGHFCIHFYQSTTHSNNLDPQHNRMVLRAAGKIK